jgi:hypothetical protein
MADGDVHLGRFVKPSEDIYSLAFAGSFVEKLVMFYYDQSREDESEKIKKVVLATINENDSKHQSELTQTKQVQDDQVP